MIWVKDVFRIPAAGFSAGGRLSAVSSMDVTEGGFVGGTGDAGRGGVIGAESGTRILSGNDDTEVSLCAEYWRI